MAFFPSLKQKYPYITHHVSAGKRTVGKSAPPQTVISSPTSESQSPTKYHHSLTCPKQEEQLKSHSLSLNWRNHAFESSPTSWPAFDIWIDTAFTYRRWWRSTGSRITMASLMDVWSSQSIRWCPNWCEPRWRLHNMLDTDAMWCCRLPCWLVIESLSQREKFFVSGVLPS